MTIPIDRWHQIYALWKARPCFICGETTNCGHRELDVALAELEAIDRGK